MVDTLLHNIPKKEEGISCHLLLLSATNLLPHSAKLSPTSQWVAEALLSIDCVGFGTLAFEKMKSTKNRSPMQLRPFARGGVGGKRCESQLSFGS